MLHVQPDDCDTDSSFVRSCTNTCSQLLHTFSIAVPEVGFDSSFYFAREGDGTVTLTVRTTNPETTGPLALRVVRGNATCELLVVWQDLRLLCLGVLVI